jgi:hypothetical protein
MFVGVPAWQLPLWQLSLSVQTLLSLHAVPSGTFGFEHWPVAGSQLPATWQTSVAVHEMGLEPAHIPVWHVSLSVHALPSLHDVPLAALGFEHPDVASQVPATWH